jgi:hypothetical protein
MTETKFTPTTWEVVNKDDYHGFYVQDRNGITICDLYFRDINKIIEHQPLLAEANAHLIAVAPEMYWQLDDILSVLKEDVNNINNLIDTEKENGGRVSLDLIKRINVIEELADKTKELLKKARGE